VKRLADYRWSSYRFYAYGRKAPLWLSTALILSQFERDEDPQKSYRQHVQKYAKEEKRLLEDLRHGLILGSKQFAEKIRKRHLSAKPDASIPQQNQLAKGSNSSSFLNKVQRLLHKYDAQRFAQAGRLRGAEKDRRDLLLYMIWKSGRLSNEQIGQLFGLSHSAVSHAVKSLKARIMENPELQEKYSRLNSQFKL
jgi:hypothetical protein